MSGRGLRLLQRPSQKKKEKESKKGLMKSFFFSLDLISMPSKYCKWVSINNSQFLFNSQTSCFKVYNQISDFPEFWSPKPQKPNFGFTLLRSFGCVLAGTIKSSQVPVIYFGLPHFLWWWSCNFFFCFFVATIYAPLFSIPYTALTNVTG